MPFLNVCHGETRVTLLSQNKSESDNFLRSKVKAPTSSSSPLIHWPSKSINNLYILTPHPYATQEVDSPYLHTVSSKGRLGVRTLANTEHYRHTDD